MIKYGYGELIMTEYRAIYKCRLCGEKFETAALKKDIANLCVNTLAITEHFRLNSDEISIDRHYIHSCSDGSYGFSDFVGFRKVED